MRLPRSESHIEELEDGSKLAISVGNIQNQFSDAQASLGEAEQEIQRLIHDMNFR